MGGVPGDALVPLSFGATGGPAAAVATSFLRRDVMAVPGGGFLAGWSDCRSVGASMVTGGSGWPAVWAQAIEGIAESVLQSTRVLALLGAR